jgi:hypothetical protein
MRSSLLLLIMHAASFVSFIGCASKEDERKIQPNGPMDLEQLKVETSEASVPNG